MMKYYEAIISGRTELTASSNKAAKEEVMKRIRSGDVKFRIELWFVPND